MHIRSLLCMIVLACSLAVLNGCAPTYCEHTFWTGKCSVCAKTHCDDVCKRCKYNEATCSLCNACINEDGCVAMPPVTPPQKMCLRTSCGKYVPLPAPTY